MKQLIPSIIRQAWIAIVCMVCNVGCMQSNRGGRLVPEGGVDPIIQPDPTLSPSDQLRTLIETNTGQDQGNVIAYLNALPPETLRGILLTPYPDGKYLILIAAKYSNSTVFERLVTCELRPGRRYGDTLGELIDRDRETILHILARRSGEEAVDIVYMLGNTFPDAFDTMNGTRDRNGRLPYQCTILAGDHADLFLAFSSRHNRSAHVQDADIMNPQHFLNFTTPTGELALCLAAEYNRPNIFRRLLSVVLGINLTRNNFMSRLGEILTRNSVLSFNPTRGTMAQIGDLINRRDGRGNTPLHYSIAHPQGQEITGLLLLTPIDPNVPNGQGDTPFHTAIIIGNEKFIYQLFENKYGPTFALSPAAHYPQVDPSATNRSGDTPFMLAVRYQRLGIVKCLIRQVQPMVGPVVSSQEVSDALVFAIKEGHTETVKVLMEEAKCSSEFLQAIRIPANYDNTLLHLAAQQDNPAIVALLLDKGLDKGAKNRLGQTPIEIATCPAIKWLLENM